MGKCIGCKCCVVACNEQNGNPAAINWRRVGEIEGGCYPDAQRVLPVDGLQPLPRADLPERLPGRRLLEGSGHRHRAAQRRRLHRLPVLHLELLVRRAAVQPRARRRRQVRHVPRPARRAGRRRPASAPARRARSQIEIVNDRRRGGRRCAAAAVRRSGMPVDDAQPVDDAHHAARRRCRRTRGRSTSRTSSPSDPHWPLVVMTVLTQLSVGAFATIWLLQLLGASTRLGVAALASLLVGGLALGASTLHLGRPVHAYRALKMWRRSWLSREVLLFTAFSGVAGALRRRCSGSACPAASLVGALTVAARHRRRDGQRLHLPRAVAAGLEHAAHAAAVQPDGGAARAAVRRAVGAGDAALAGAGGGGDGRRAVRAARRCASSGCIASDSLELRGTARLLSTVLAQHVSCCAACCSVAGGDRAAARRPSDLPAAWRCGRRARARARRRDARPLPVLRQRRAQAHGHAVPRDRAARPHEPEATARPRHPRRRYAYGVDPVAGYISAQKIAGHAGWRPPAATARSAAACSSASRTAAPSACAAIPIIR